MRIFIFKSDAKSDLRAFGGDLTGSQLPKQFSPWHAIGAVAPDRDPPHDLSREVIETLPDLDNEPDFYSSGMA